MRDTQTSYERTKYGPISWKPDKAVYNNYAGIKNNPKKQEADYVKHKFVTFMKSVNKTVFAVDKTLHGEHFQRLTKISSLLFVKTMSVP